MKRDFIIFFYYISHVGISWKSIVNLITSRVKALVERNRGEVVKIL